ncbi:hypothetical protein ACWDGI_11965 [Streptomyces sp. NPDC001220]
MAKEQTTELPGALGAGQADAGLFGTRLGTALLVCGHVTVFTTVIFATSVVGRRIESAHARAEWQVRQNELVQAFMDHPPAVVFIKDLDGRGVAPCPCRHRRGWHRPPMATGICTFVEIATVSRAVVAPCS